MRTAIQVLEEAIRLEAEKSCISPIFHSYSMMLKFSITGIFMAMLFMLVNLMNMSFPEMISIQC